MDGNQMYYNVFFYEKKYWIFSSYACSWRIQLLFSGPRRAVVAEIMSEIVKRADPAAGY